MVHLGPIFRALLRRKLGVFLLILQIVTTVTLFSNIAYVIYKMNELNNRPSGIDEKQLFTIFLQRPPTIRYADYSDVQRDLAGIKNVPGVAMAAMVSDTPLGWRQVRVTLKVNNRQDAVVTVAQKSNVSPDTIVTLGLHLIAGRHFTESDMMLALDNKPGVIIITQLLAENLFGKNNRAIGKLVYENGIAQEIVGITENWLGFAPQAEVQEPTAFYPAYKNAAKKNSYLVRAMSVNERNAVIEKVSHYIRQTYPNELILWTEKTDDVKARQMKDKGAVTLLIMLMVALSIVVAFAIGGQTFFWSKRRARQFSIRRALGANHSDIIAHIMVENIIICGIGLIIGAICSVYLNQIVIGIMSGMKPMPPLFLLGTCAILFCIFLISAAIPAMRTIKNSSHLAIKIYKHTEN